VSGKVRVLVLVLSFWWVPPGFVYGLDVGCEKCDSLRDDLVDEVILVCNNYTVETADSVKGTKEQLDRANLELLACVKEAGFPSESDSREFFVRVTYVLSEVNFYLRAKDQFEEDSPETWEQRRGFLKQSVESECQKFRELSRGGI
jgi:hypothetical protein